MPRLKRLMRELLRHRPILIDMEERGADSAVGQQARTPVVAQAVCLAYPSKLTHDTIWDVY